MSSQRAKGEITKDTRNHEKSASEHRQTGGVGGTCQTWAYVPSPGLSGALVFRRQPFYPCAWHFVFAVLLFVDLLFTDLFFSRQRPHASLRLSVLVLSFAVRPMTPRQPSRCGVANSDIVVGSVPYFSCLSANGPTARLHKGTAMTAV